MKNYGKTIRISIAIFTPIVLIVMACIILSNGVNATEDPWVWLTSAKGTYKNLALTDGEQIDVCYTFRIDKDKIMRGRKVIVHKGDKVIEKVVAVNGDIIVPTRIEDGTFNVVIPVSKEGDTVEEELVSDLN